MNQSKTYQNIDMKQTGLKLKKYMYDLKLSVKDIQEYLHLSCPQPVYRWINGKILPSVDHLFMLSELFEVHMEELLVKNQSMPAVKVTSCKDKYFKNRILIYFKEFMQHSA